MQRVVVPRQALRRCCLLTRRGLAIHHSISATARAAAPRRVLLNYHEKPAGGLRLGRYIVPPTHFQYDVVDTQVPTETVVYDGRLLTAPATIETTGFSLQVWPTMCSNFGSDWHIVRTYYEEMRALIKELTGADAVVVFDHAVRSTAPTVTPSSFSAAGPVHRVHCDYTTESAPQQLQRLADRGVYSQSKRRVLSKVEIERLMGGRFAFFNVWRNISAAPVQTSPLAVCDASTVSVEDHLYYEVISPIYDDHANENLALRFSDSHRWYCYPEMLKDECLIFKEFDSEPDRPQLVFHTAFDDPLASSKAHPRESIEVRAVAFFDIDDYGEGEVLHKKMTMKQGKITQKDSAHE